MTNVEIMERAVELAKMNDEMRELDDENLVMTWLSCGVPDDAQPEEFPEWAADDNTFNEFKALYEKLKALAEGGE